MSQTVERSDLRNAVDEEDWSFIQASLTDLHPADVAELIADAPRHQQKHIFSLVAFDRQPDVLAELENEDAADEVLEELSASQITRIVDQMAPDDAADLLAELPEQQSEEVLSMMEADGSRDIRNLLQYEEDSAGGIMTTDVVSMRGSQTVAEALDAILHMDAREKFYLANVVGPKGHLLGYIDLWDLLREANRDRPLSELMNTKFVSATVDMDQEEVANLLSKYDLDVLPVLDGDGVLVGRITADDVLDVIEEEASEDIFRLAGSDDAELESPSVLASCAARLPWLFVTLLGGFVTSLILRAFQEHLHNAIVLAAFVPIVLAMGGNTGIQSSTLVVRSIALGNTDKRNIIHWLGREMLAGASMGIICGTVIGAWAHIMVQMGAPIPGLEPIKMAIIVGTALFAAMTFASSFGAFVPTVLQKLGIDPAVAAGPFVTITNDITALLIYYEITWLLMVGL